jgi:hypothetical protein
MRTLPKLAFAGAAALGIAGAASAASPAKHAMDVALPDGGTAHIEYYGDVAPKVTIAPGPLSPFSVGWAAPAFPDMQRVFEQLDRARAAMMREVRQMPRANAPGAADSLNVASFGKLPAGANSVSVVSVSNGAGTCTRTTEVTSQGQGKPPKVVSKISGQCSGGEATAPAAPAGPATRA